MENNNQPQPVSMQPAQNNLLQQPPQEIKRPYSSKLFFIVLGVILFIAIGVSVLFFWKRDFLLQAQLDKSHITLPTQIPSLTVLSPVVTPVMRDWKNYTNTEHKVSFSYPPEFSLKEQNNGSQQFIITLERSEEKFVLDIQPTQPLSHIMARAKSTTTINNTTWGVILPSHYCDAGQCSDTYPSYVIAQSGFDYQFILKKKTSDSSAIKILETFRFTTQSLSQQEIDKIKQSVAQKLGQSLDEVHVTIDPVTNNYNGQFAVGQVGPASGNGGGALWYAAKVNGIWETFVITQSSVTCDLVNKYNFPKESIPTCMDNNNNAVTR